MTAPLYVHLPHGGTLPTLGPAPFITLLVAESIALEDWQNKICEDLARAGCRYFVAWGQDCAQWCAVMAGTSGAAENLVMTAAYDDDPLAEAMWFAVHGTEHPAITLEALVIAHVTPRERRDEILFQFQSAALREKPGI